MEKHFSVNTHLGWVVILCIFLHIVLVFGQPSPQADVINNCVNSTNSTSCSHTYEQVYKSLAKCDNNFNISHALYPGRSKPSSVRVFVNVYGPNKTKDSTPAMYTWSMSCLYATVPAVVLEFLSLGSILVTPRTQELNIHIPLFCCNVSENKNERETIIEGMLARILAELQDLAVSPGIQDPTLNTAECVIQGHQPDIDATGLSSYIRAILWCSFLSVIILGPIIAFFSLDVFENDPEKKDFVCCATHPEEDCLICSFKYCCCDRSVACYQKENPLTRSAKCVCYLLLLTEFCLIIFVVKFFTYKNMPLEIYIFYILLMVEGIIISTVRCIVQCYKKGRKYKYIELCYRRFVFITCANVISYHFCWLIVGIMINPTWGLTVFAVVCFVSVVLFFSVYAICDADEDSFCQRFIMFTLTFVGLCFVASLTVLAGQSFYGKDTADQIVKTALLYVVGGITWLLRKGQVCTSYNPPDYSIPSSEANHAGDQPSDPEGNEVELHEVREEIDPFVNS